MFVKCENKSHVQFSITCVKSTTTKILPNIERGIATHAIGQQNFSDKMYSATNQVCMNVSSKTFTTLLWVNNANSRTKLPKAYQPS